MLKGIVLGTMAGALLATAAWLAIAKKAEAAPEPGIVAKKAAEPAAAAPSPELDAAKGENAKLRDELASLQKKDAAKPSAPGKSRPAAVLAWKEIGAKIYKLRDQMKNKDEQTPEMTEMWGDFLAILSDAAKKDGVTVEEAILGPSGMMGLLCAVLEGSDLAPDAAQQEKLDAFMASQEDAWKKYLAARGDKPAIELNRDLLAMGAGGLGRFKDLLSKDQYAMMDDMSLWKDAPSMGMHSSIGGDRATVASSLADRWKGDLGLDDTQKASIGPIVDEYMRGYDELQAEQARKAAAGEKPDEWAESVEEADLMVAAQKRIKETLRLSTDQEAALKAWKGRYGYTISK